MLHVIYVIYTTIHLSLSIYRHQQSNSRPSFTDLVTTLSNGSGLLNWSESDKQTHKQATLLGASLDTAENLYIDLQLIYA